MIRTGIAAATVLAFVAGPAAAQEKTVKIGFISTFSGPPAAIGNDMRNSFELGLDHLGRKLGGLPVEVIYEDDQLKPEVGVQKTQKLIESDKVDFVVGYIWSNVILASLKPLVDSKTMTVVTNAGASQLAGELCSPYVFSTSWNNDQTPQAMGLYMNQKGDQEGLPDRAQLCRRPRHAGRRAHDLPGGGRRPGNDPLARPARFLRRAFQGPRGAAGRDLRVLSRRRRRAVRHPIRAVRPQGPDSALHRVHHRRAVDPAAQGSGGRRSRRPGMGQRSSQRDEQEIRRRLHGEVQGPALVLRRADL